MIAMDLTPNNFTTFAAHHYDNPHCVDDMEFQEDLKRFQYIKRLLNKYKQTGELRHRLILNHVIIIHNVFGVVPGTKMLIHKLINYLPELKPFLVMTHTCPEQIVVCGTKIVFSDIAMDNNIVSLLRKI